MRLNKPLTPSLLDFLQRFYVAKHIQSKVDNNKFGYQGEFACNELDINVPQPDTQPSHYCPWKPSGTGDSIIYAYYKRDSGTYEAAMWLMYLIEKILKPNGYVIDDTMVTHDGRIWCKSNIISYQYVNQTERTVPNVPMTLRLDYPYIDKESQKLMKPPKKVSKTKILEEKVEVLSDVLKSWIDVDKLLKEIDDKYNS
jgi:hypothetical protein